MSDSSDSSDSDDENVTVAQYTVILVKESSLTYMTHLCFVERILLSQSLLTFVLFSPFQLSNFAAAPVNSA